MAEGLLIEAEEHARAAVDAASDKQAADVVMLDLRGVSDFTDYFVVLTTESARQMESVAEEVQGALKRAGATLHHREGTPGSGWMLLDFGDVIAHLFTPEKREFYLLEEAWSQATETVRIQ